MSMKRQVDLKASIVIPTKDKNERLVLVLKAFERQVREDVEVIVVFDGCRPSTLNEFDEISFSYKPKKIVLPENRGRAVARNQGIAAAKGEIIIFVDDDRIPESNFIDQHIASHANGDCVVLGQRKEIELDDKFLKSIMFSGKLNSLFGNQKFITDLQAQSYEDKFHSVGKKPKSRIRWMHFFTGNVSVKKMRVDEVGRFDENFVKWGSEDVDLGIRLYLKGIPFIHNKNIINYHIEHAGNYTQRLNEVNETHSYLTSKYKKYFRIYIILFLQKIHYKYFGTKRRPKEF